MGIDSKKPPDMGKRKENPAPIGFYHKYIKRPLDLVMSFLALVILSPLFLITAILVRVKLGGPILFKQERPGLGEKIFTLYKFRTMTDAKDKNGELLPDGERLTRFGKMLRRTSIDELPEFFNVLKGDMSLVGPRPLLVQYLPLYNDHQKHRHDVRPGLSGLAQVNGRNAISWPSRFDFDMEYIENLSFAGDCKIVFQTIMKVFQRQGISSGSSETMEAFRGEP